MRTAFVVSSLILASAISVYGHGYMSTPFCRGCEKASFKVDDLKSPNKGGQMCRGEPAGKVTNVGHSVTLEFNITAPHVGECDVFILDSNLANPVKAANKTGCAAPGAAKTWPITIPNNINGQKVLRWVWTATHTNPPELYEQCADINISSS